MPALKSCFDIQITLKTLKQYFYLSYGTDALYALVTIYVLQMPQSRKGCNKGTKYMLNYYKTNAQLIVVYCVN